jgi:hypothetical protein
VIILDFRLMNSNAVWSADTCHLKWVGGESTPVIYYCKTKLSSHVHEAGPDQNVLVNNLYCEGDSRGGSWADYWQLGTDDDPPYPRRVQAREVRFRYSTAFSRTS